MRNLLKILAILTLPSLALAGDTNYVGRVIIQDSYTAPTCSTASGDGMLCVEKAVELQDTLAVTGATTLTGAVTFAGGLDCGDDNITNVGDIALDTISSDGSTIGIVGDTLTSGGTDDYALTVTGTLNDTGAAGGTDVYRAIKVNVTTTDITGWDNVYLLDLQDTGTSRFSVSDTGIVTVASSLSCVALSAGDGNVTNVGNIDVDTIQADDGTSWAGSEIGSLTSATANAASAGFTRVANTECHGFRNAANDGDESMCVDGSDNFTFSDAIVATGSVTAAGFDAGDSNITNVGNIDVDTVQADDGTSWAGEEIGSLTSATANSASAGFTRVANTECLGWRNAANDGDESLCVDGSDDLTYSDAIVATGTVTGSSGLDAGDNNITNVADIAVDSISADGGTTIGVSNNVDVDSKLLYGQLTGFEDIGASDTMDADDCGKTITTSTDTAVITLPDAAAGNIGCRITFVVTAADDAAKVSISPDASDGVFGMCCGVNDVATTACAALSGTVNKDLECQKAEQNKGDSVTLVSDGSTGWYTVGCVGAGWASES